MQAIGRSGPYLLQRIQTYALASVSTQNFAIQQLDWHSFHTSSHNLIRKITRPYDRPELNEKEPWNAKKPELVSEVLGSSHFSSQEKVRQRMKDAMQIFQRADGDTGSSEVQKCATAIMHVVAMLTERIYNVAEHMKKHHKDIPTRRGLEALLTRRRKLLQYLRRTSFDTYATVLAHFGLKDSYRPGDRYSMIAASRTYNKPSTKKRKRR